jgi:hypothetical protein
MIAGNAVTSDKIADGTIVAADLSTDAIATVSKTSFTAQSGVVTSSAWFDATASDPVNVPGGIYVIRIELNLSATSTETLYARINSGRIMTFENPVASAVREFEYIYINDTPSSSNKIIPLLLKTSSSSMTVNSGKINIYRIGKL